MTECYRVRTRQYTPTQFMRFIHSFSFKCFILDRVVLDLKSVPGTLGVKVGIQP